MNKWRLWKKRNYILVSLSVALLAINFGSAACAQAGAPPEPSPVPKSIPSSIPKSIPKPETAPYPLSGNQGSSSVAPVPVQVAPADSETYMPALAPVRSRPLSSSTQSTTLQTGTGSTTLQTGTGSTLIQSGTDSSTIQAGVQREAVPANILFIVDGSRSMLEELEHSTQKMDAAKQVLQQALSRIPNDVNIGLARLGQGAVSQQPSMFLGGFGGINMGLECQNSALWVPIGEHNRRSFIEKVRQIKPYGMTPLAYAIRMAAHSDFKNCLGTKTIILITDGADTCGGNPCEEIARLPQYGIHLKVDVVGLALGREPDARRQLDCIARNSGGKYYDAKSSAELINSISASVSKAIEGRVVIKPSSGSVEPGSGASINTETPVELVPIELMKSLDK